MYQLTPTTTSNEKPQEKNHTLEAVPWPDEMQPGFNINELKHCQYPPNNFTLVRHFQIHKGHTRGWKCSKIDVAKVKMFFITWVLISFQNMARKNYTYLHTCITRMWRTHRMHRAEQFPTSTPLIECESNERFSHATKTATITNKTNAGHNL